MELVHQLEKLLKVKGLYLLVAFFISFQANAQLSITAGVIIEEAQSSNNMGYEDVKLVDIDGDNDNDMIIVRDLATDLVLKNNGSGIFTQHQVIDFAGTTNRTYEYFMVDVDGDTDLDAIVRFSGLKARVLINNGSGTFTDSGQLLGNTGLFGTLAVGNLNGDAHVDIIQASETIATVFINNGSGVFTAGQVLNSSSFSGIGSEGFSTIGLLDLDRDSDLDVIFVGDDLSFIYSNNGSASFTSTGNTLGNSRNLRQAVADFNGDSFDDFYLEGGGGIDGFDLIHSFNFNNGSLNPPQSVTNKVTMNIGTIGDLDLDNDLDYASGDKFYLNNGSGTTFAADPYVFSIPVTTPGAGLKTVVETVGDVDGDGDLDIVASDGSYDFGTDITYLKLRLFINNAPSANAAPTASSFTAANGTYEDLVYTFATANFSYADGDNDALDHVRVTAVPANGTLYIDANNSDSFNSGEQLANGNTVSKANLDAGNLQYVQSGSSTNTTFTFDVNDGTDYSASTYTATLNIIAKPTVTLSISPSSKAENTTSTNTVTATLSNTYGATVTVNLGFIGTATLTDDYTRSASSISISAGQPSGTITLVNVGDTKDENDETVIVDISTVTNGSELNTQQVTYTITDDDDPSSLSIADVNVSEGNSGTKTLQFTITLSPASGKNVTVNYATADNTATTADSDYSAIGTTGLTFTAGQTTKTIDVTINGDAVFEADESFFVNLSSAVNATIGTQGTGTITNDEAAADLNIQVFLEGSLDVTTMITTLRANNSLPTVQPYSNATSETSSSIPATAVDWIEIELRTGTAANTKVGTNRAGILKSDGTVVDKDGNAFTMSQADGTAYYIVIHHRNHLSIMSASAVSLSSGAYTIDFTSASATTHQGTTGLASLSGGKFGMLAGDADGDGDVDATDLTTWRAQNGDPFIYNSTNADFNLDGEINAVDRNDFQQKNNMKSSQVPTT